MSDDLRDRLAAALNSAPTKLIHDNPEAVAFHRAGLGDEVLSSRHDRHHYCATCALCRGETETLVDAVLAELQPELARFEEVRARHDGMILELRNYEARDERLKAERDAALATLARVRELAAELDREHEEHRLDSDPLWMLAGLANADRLRTALAGPAGAGSTQDGA